MESFEKVQRSQTERSEKGEKDGNKPTDTIFYKSFNKEESDSRLLVLERIKQNEQQQEVLKSRFMELTALFEKGRMDTPVEVAGEKHWMEINKFFNGHRESKVNDLSSQVVNGKTAPSQINIEFNLVGTEGRPENLNINFRVSAERLLEGGGRLEADLRKNITDIFGGTSNHYKKIVEASELEESQKEKQETPPVDMIQKRAMEEGLLATGAIVTGVSRGNVFTLIAEYPAIQKKVFVSVFGDKEPWRLEKITGHDERVENFLGPPQNVLPEIYRFIENRNG